ncbi:MAG TPA: hypothetical protein HPP66_13025 [Planctomycetes bacterium]|nr:hypothetical protein [Planctomycetota bacterium]
MTFVAWAPLAKEPIKNAATWWREITKKKPTAVQWANNPQHRTGGYIKRTENPPTAGVGKTATQFPPPQGWGLNKMTVLAEYLAIIGGYSHFVSFTEHLTALLGRITLEGYRKQKLADLLDFFLDEPQKTL